MQKSPVSGNLSLHRGRVGEPGRNSLAGTFCEKRIVYLGSFLVPRGHQYLSLRVLWNFGKETGLC